MYVQKHFKRDFLFIFISTVLLNFGTYAQSIRLDPQLIPKQNQLATPPVSIQEASSEQVLIFISSSMPVESLKQWFIQAQNIHAPVILRGLVQNSLPATQQWLATIVGTNAVQYGVQIDPVAFERYDIEQVPAVVVSSKTTTCPVNMSCPAPSFEVVYGNIGLPKALDIIANSGENAP